MVLVSSPYGTLPGAPEKRRRRAPQITGVVALLAVAGVAMACLVLYASRSNAVSLLSKTHTLAHTYETAEASRQDLNEYFDSWTRTSKAAKVKRHLTSDAAKKEIGAIFRNARSDDPDAAIRREEKRAVMQDLAYSADVANSDLDSYFDSMQESNHKAMVSHQAKMVDEDGLPVLHPKQAQAAQEETEVNKMEIENYKKHNQDFKARMDKVHLMWMKKHAHLPKTEAETREYAELVSKYVGNIADIVSKARTSSSLKQDPKLRKQALQKYLRENPDVEKKMEEAKKIFFGKYKHAPQTDKENKEYHDLMKKYVGHIDIDVSTVLGKGQMHKSRTQRLAAKAASNPMMDVDEKQREHNMEAFDAWMKKHAAEIKNPTGSMSSFFSQAKKDPSGPWNALTLGMGEDGPEGGMSEGPDGMPALPNFIKAPPQVDGAKSGSNSAALVQHAEVPPPSAHKVDSKASDKPKRHRRDSLIDKYLNEHPRNTAKPKQAVDDDGLPVLPEIHHAHDAGSQGKMKELARYEKNDPAFAKKVMAAHKAWADAGHTSPPHTPAEEREYAKILKESVGASLKNPSHVKKVNVFHAPSLGDQFKVAAGKGVSSLAADAQAQSKAVPASKHTDTEIKMARVKALQDLEAHDPQVKAKIQKAHEAWIASGHQGPPANGAEEKEYHALMEKIVGHPDINFQIN